MRITEISVGCGRTIPHPKEPGVSYKPFITLRARLEPDDVPWAAASELQVMADQMIELHLADISAGRSQAAPAWVPDHDSVTTGLLSAAIRQSDAKDSAGQLKQ